MRSAEAVLQLHERLCYQRANPEDGVVLAEVESLLAGFAARTDLRRHRQRLADTGIVGTDIHYPFFWPTARWLAAHWPRQLSIDWEQIDDDRPLAAALPLLVSPVEATWLRLSKPSPRDALARLAGATTTDAVFLIRRVAAMAGNDSTREAFYDGIAPPLLLKADVDTPTRTTAYYPPTRIYFQNAQLERSRPDLGVEMKRPPRSVRNVSVRNGQRLIDLAREAMVTRGRDLDAFAYGDPRDVRLIDDGEGLAWAMIGFIAERRPTLRTSYGYLTLRNGVPIGYVQADVLWRCVDLAFNTFDTFRGHDSAAVLGRTMAMLRHQFDATSFTLEPYQLGEGNDEGIQSGAWWFYYKLGFRPRNRLIRSVVTTELERMERNPRHRSSATTLRKLARDYLYLDRPGARAPLWPRLAFLGAQIAGRENGSLIAASHQFPDAWSQATTNERAALAAWAPVIALLPGLDDWSPDERSGLIEVILAKAGHRDTDYLRLFEGHPRLGESLRRLTRA